MKATACRPAHRDAQSARKYDDENQGNVKPFIDIGCLNSRTALSKAELIHHLINERALDLLAVTESWVTNDTPAAIRDDIRTATGLMLMRYMRRDKPYTADRGEAAETRELQLSTVILSPYSHIL